ncbi:hypothetical protein ABTZ59_36735 [Streptomyces sp. NPDC094034]|uniref:hypothetical protein n=1 Tax=Streptomyces sp. NPDC094034 TaxID=3155309 RepID=UPI00333001C7
MTKCPGGDHDFPVEDDDGARCEEHGITLLWNGPPITEDDLLTEAGALAPCGPCLAAPLFDLSSPHRCLGRSVARALVTGITLTEPQPCPCPCPCDCQRQGAR